MPKGPELAIGFRNQHSSNGVRSIPLLSERLRQFTQPPLYPIRLDVRELLPIYARRAPIGAALGIDSVKNILAVQLVVQGIEAIARLSLRFRV